MAPPRGDTVTLPYNMVWGDSQQRLAALFAGVGAKITDKKANGPSEVWTVTGLIAPDLQTSLFTFSGGMLAAMEFDYSQPDWDLPKYNDKMGLFRRVLESKCGGPGNMISRDTKQAPNSPIKESLMGYQWDRGDTTVQLFYFSAEDTSKNLNFRTISVHYHYKDPMQGMDQTMPDDRDVGGSSGPVDPNSNPLFGGSGRPAGGGASATPTPSPTPIPTPAPSPSPEATSTVSPEPSPAGSPEASASPAMSTTPEPSPSVSSTASLTPTPKPTPAPKGKGKKPTPKPPENTDPLPE